MILLDASAGSESRAPLLAAGLAIGLCPWIKNEGQPFAIAAIGVAAWKFRGRTAWILAGAAPGLIATIVLKLLTDGREQMFPDTLGAAAAKLGDPSRWGKSFLGFGKAVWEAGPVWAHPVLLVVALAVVLRCVTPAERRARLWLAIPIAVTIAAEFGMYLITNADIDWHISTSVQRLVAQAWPSLLWLVFSVMRTPEEYFDVQPDPVAVPAEPSKRKRAKTQ